MSVSLNDSLSNLVQIKHQDKHRWIYHRGSFSCVHKSKVPCFSIKKIEMVLLHGTAALKKYSRIDVDQVAAKDLKRLKKLVIKKVEMYKEVHTSKVYRFFCRLFFGNIDDISQNLIKEIDRLTGTNPVGGPNSTVTIPGGNEDPIRRDPLSYPEPDFDTRISNLERRFPRLNGNGNTIPIGTFQNGFQNLGDGEVSLEPPTYAPYQPPLEDDVKAEENKIKRLRLKFYSLFSKKIQLIGQGKLNLPLFDVEKIRNAAGKKEGPFFTIYFQRDPDVAMLRKKVEEGTMKQEDMDKLIPSVSSKDLQEWFDQELQTREVNVAKKEDLPPIATKYKQRVAKRYTFSFEEAQKLINDQEKDGIVNLKDLVGHEIKIHPSYSCELYGNECHVENTIGLTLAHLNSDLHNKFSDFKSLSTDQLNQSPIPQVTFDHKGMSIKIAENQTNLLNVIQQVLGLEFESIEEDYFGHKYKHQFNIPRKDIENFLKILGLEKISPDSLYYRYSGGNITYLQHLIETNRHYTSVRTDDALQSIKETLVNLVPNINQERAHVAYHPGQGGRLSIKLSSRSPEYNSKLAEFLKCELRPLPTDQIFNYETYNSEIVIENGDMKEFFKQLNLENTPDKKSYLERFQEYASPTSIDVFHMEKNNQDLDLPKTLARTLSALDSGTKDLLQSDRQVGNHPFAEVKLYPEQIEIRIPKGLNNKSVHIGPNTILSFGEYLSHTFGIEGQKEREDYYLYVPFKRIKSFLEKDLNLNRLPNQYKKDDLSTYFGLYCKETGQEKPCGSIADLSLHNSFATKDEKVPEMSEAEILTNVDSILTNGSQRNTRSDLKSRKELYINNFRNILAEFRPPTVAPMFHDHYADSRKMCYAYLQGIMHELMNNTQLTLDEKCTIIVEICAEWDASCAPGKVTRIQDIYQDLKTPVEFDDKVKGVLLHKVWKFKKATLKKILSDSQSVHSYAKALVEWGDEFGLDKEAGRRDANWQFGNVGRRDKDIFKQECERNLLNEVYESLKQDKNPQGLFLHYEDFAPRLKKILEEDGIEADKIDEELAKIMDNRMITKKAVMLLLINIGVLNP